MRVTIVQITNSSILVVSDSSGVNDIAEPLRSGKKYRRIKFASKWYNFVFDDSVSFQSGNMALVCKERNVANSEESWATGVLVEVIAS
nr:hypothetical protein [Pantoea brenneri]